MMIHLMTDLKDKKDISMDIPAKYQTTLNLRNHID